MGPLVSKFDPHLRSSPGFHLGFNRHTARNCVRIAARRAIFNVLGRLLGDLQQDKFCPGGISSPLKHDKVLWEKSHIDKQLDFRLVYKDRVDVPSIHITQLLGIQSPTNISRWCEINPQSLGHQSQLLGVWPQKMDLLQVWYKVSRLGSVLEAPTLRETEGDQGGSG